MLDHRIQRPGNVSTDANCAPKSKEASQNKQIMDVKVSSGKKKTWWQVRECVSFTLFVTEFSPSIYLEKSPAEMIEREDRRGNHLIKLRHLCLILRGQLQTREEILSQCASFLKTTAS